MIILPAAVSSFSQTSSKRTDATTPLPVTDIHKVDFLNLTYHSSLWSQEYGRQGIGKLVRVRHREFKNKNVYFAVADKKIIYADVTGDGNEEAIVPGRRSRYPKVRRSNSLRIIP
jgi:hypothetical protein